MHGLDFQIRTPCKGSYWYHCFTSEKYFHRLFNCFDEYEPLLQKSKGLISADFSLYRDYPEKFLIDYCRSNRMIDYALQQAGIPMIPTAGFAGESSWDWCFDGLPTNSTVAVTTNTLGKDPEANRLFVGGVNAMKVTDKNAITVAEYYLSLGMYVIFLCEIRESRENRPDLLVDFKFLVEAKGITFPNPN